MNFFDAYNLIAEHHGDEFKPELMRVSLKKLLDVLGEDEKNKPLYKNIEAWISNNSKKLTT